MTDPQKRLLLAVQDVLRLEMETDKPFRKPYHALMQAYCDVTHTDPLEFKEEALQAASDAIEGQGWSPISHIYAIALRNLCQCQNKWSC